jgi:glycine reductase
VNQFFGGVGGEEQAGLEPIWVEGSRGPGRLFARLAPDFEIVGTIVFGDNYVAENASAGAAEVVELLRQHGGADLVVAGPAFLAGRYGLGCAAICRAVIDALGISAVTAMHADNPGFDAYRGEIVVVGTAENVAGMNEAIEGLVTVGRKLAHGDMLDPEHDPVLATGRRRNVFAEETGAERAVAMLLAKLGGQPFETEYPMPVFDRVPPAPPVLDPGTAEIALVTSGGIVPKGNPDRIRSANAQGWGRYDVRGLDALAAERYETVHGGYDPTHANADPNRVLPLDMARALERDGRIGRIHNYYYATVGNATEVASARRFGREIVERLIADGVQAVILTST